MPIPCENAQIWIERCFEKECIHQKLHFWKFSMDSVQYNAEHCGINDDTDDEHSV